MEFTRASALSQEGPFGHSAHVLLVLSLLTRTLPWLRRRDGISRALEAAFARNCRDKNVEINRLVSVGGVPDRRPA